MTEKEAVKILNDTPVTLSATCKTTAAEYHQMLHYVENALEKQIPKKPQVYNTFERHCECGAIVKSYCNYCYECGQALDWSE